MKRANVKAHGPNKKLKYTNDDLQKALNDVKNGMPIIQACNKYGVPPQTIRDKCSGKSNPIRTNPGPACDLGHEIEKKLVTWIIKCGNMGFAVDKDMLLDVVQKIVKQNNLTTGFIDGRPSRQWFYKFLKRHPGLSQKHAEYINRARGRVTERSIRRWFNEVRKILGPDAEILKFASRVFNMDESGFVLSPKSKLIIGKKGKHVYNDSARSNKEAITTLFSVNANGVFAPPMTLFKYVRIPKSVVDNGPLNWGLGKSKTGWMTSETFYEYMANVFYLWLVENNVQFPVIVFLDGHTSHLSLELSEFCASHGIILVALYPNATHLLQPLDVSVFGPMKAKWKQLCRQWRIDHDGEEIRKENVPKVLSSVISDVNMAKNVRSGFRCTGLFPFDENSVDYSKIIDRDFALDVTEPASNLNQNANNEHLLFIEKNIDTNVLATFKQSGSQWNGDVQYEELFKFWRKIALNQGQLEMEFINEEESATIMESSELLNSHENDVENVTTVEESTNYVDNMYEYEDSSSSIVVEPDIQYTLAHHPSHADNSIDILPPNHQTEGVTSGPHTSNFIIYRQRIPDVNNGPPSIRNGENLVNILPPNDQTDRRTSDKRLKNSLIYRGPSPQVDNLLTWPKQPTPTSKRKITELPSVLTSLKWQEIQKKRQNEKEEIEKNKKIKKDAALKKKEMAMKQKEARKRGRKPIKKKPKRVETADDSDDSPELDDFYKTLKSTFE